jgi:hypothetical protein
MVNRVLKGKNGAGQYGFWVSKPGIDVFSANVMQMAFSSDFVPPKLVITGTVVNGPTSGPGPFSASGAVPGAEQTVNSIAYGRTVTPIPAAFGIATAADWTLPLAVGGAQLGYLANRWHTHVLETPDAGVVINEYGPSIVKTTTTQANQVSINWHSARFIIVPYTDHIDVITNCRNNVTVKYLVLENQ